MEKTTVYLTTQQKAALARAAAAEGRSEARLIRAGIDVVTAGHRAAEAPASLGGESAGLAGIAVPAMAGPVAGRPRWLARDGFVRVVLGHQADHALLRDLREMAPESTDEAPDPVVDP